MGHLHKATALRALAAVAVAMFIGGSPWAVAQAAPSNGDSDVEVLTRGPIHEAFAEPSAYNPTQGIVVTKEPPTAINEIPPEDKPDEDGVSWIPGYWAWDGERADYIWVSGVWRVPPSGRSWVPGYWRATAGGWSWTSGFWMDANSDEVQYLPKPPDSLEVGPSSPSPAADQLWTPGNWAWTDNQYAWQPGYWVPARPDWVWEPSHYLWSSRGYIYNDGYWDRSLDRRGVLFAPIYVQPSVYSRPGYAYSPSVAIQAGLLTTDLFVSASSRHYYFGDYYGDQYSQKGIRPWFAIDQNHRGYDPIYAQQKWEHGRADSQWGANLLANYQFRQQHAEARPARTYSAQAARAAQAPAQERANLLIAAPLAEVSARHATATPFVKIDQNRRKALGDQGKNLSTYRDARVKWESPGNTAPQVESTKARQQAASQATMRPSEEQARPVSASENSHVQSRNVQQAAEPARENLGQDRPSRQPESATSQRVKIPKSPIVGNVAGVGGRDDNPPVRPEPPRPAPSRPAPIIQSMPAQENRSQPVAPSSSRPSGNGNQDRKDH